MIPPNYCCISPHGAAFYPVPITAYLAPIIVNEPENYLTAWAPITIPCGVMSSQLGSDFTLSTLLLASSSAGLSTCICFSDLKNIVKQAGGGFRVGLRSLNEPPSLWTQIILFSWRFLRNFCEFRQANPFFYIIMQWRI